MKKILFVVHAFRTGGVSTVLTNIANGLCRRGYDITICVTSDDVSGAGDLLPEIKLRHRDEPHLGLLRKIPYVRNFYESGMWSKRQSPRKLYRYFVGGKERYDVEIAFFFGRPLKAVYGSKNDRARKILFVHSDYKGLGKGIYMGFRQEEEAKRAYRFFDKVVCVTNGVKTSFVDTIGRQDGVEVIYNLNDCEKIKVLSRQEIAAKRVEFTFVCVSRLSAEKGIARVLESAAKLNDEGFAFDVWIVGDGPERARLEQYAARCRLQNVTFYGNQKNPYPFIANADMLVCPSLTEAYGLSISEAFILHKPILATDCTGPRELLNGGEYGVLVPNDPDAVCDGMKRILQDAAYYEHYCRKAEERSAFFDADHIMQEIERLINE